MSAVRDAEAEMVHQAYLRVHWHLWVARSHFACNAPYLALLDLLHAQDARRFARFLRLGVRLYPREGGR